MRTGLKRRALFASLVATVGAPTVVRAQSAFPSRPIRIVHGYSAASNPDTIARLISPSLIETLGQSVIVEPKPGAGERIAAQYLIAQPADGHTLHLMTGGANVLSATDPRVPFNTLRDFTYILTLTMFPFAIVVASNSPWRTLKDLLEAARKSPGKLSYGHGGIGQQVADVLNGRLDLAIGTFTVYQAALRGGQARALAVTSKERWAEFPDVPAIDDDVPGYEVVSWLGLAAPAGLPADVTEKLSGATRVAVARPEVRSRLQTMGNDPRSSTSAEFRARIESDYAKWQSLAKLVNP